MSKSAKVTERTFYAPMMDVIRLHGGQGVQEVKYNSVPDIEFTLGMEYWLLSVKIGQDSKTIKDALVQYLRHKEESEIPYGVLILLPEKIRKTEARESALANVLKTEPVTAIIDAQDFKTELSDRSFANVIQFLATDILAKVQKREHSYYPMKLVLNVLRQQVEEVMAEIKIDQNDIVRIITDLDLLSNLGRLKKKYAKGVTRFLGSYIFLSQLLFLRLLSKGSPDLVDIERPADKKKLREAFKKVRSINYKPIYEFDVLDSIKDAYVTDTFDLIWLLEMERVRYELPGRLFHELMPHEIRKLLAAFYTRPYAADILAMLAIDRYDDRVFDPACGSGTILTSAYRAKSNLSRTTNFMVSEHKQFCEDDIYGADIMPFAVHLTSANLSAMDPSVTISRIQIIQGDSLTLEPKSYPAGIEHELFPVASHASTMDGAPYQVDLESQSMDAIVMNPPFTKIERGISKFVDMKRFSRLCGKEVGLWGHFLILADIFLRKDGKCGAVIPINILRGRKSAAVRSRLFSQWTPMYVLKATQNYGFSEFSEYRDIILVAKKTPPKASDRVKFCLVKKDLTGLDEDDIIRIVGAVKKRAKLRDNPLVDIDTHSMSTVKKRMNNLMWFCGVTSLEHRDILVGFIEKFESLLGPLPDDKSYSMTGFRADGGSSAFLAVTRHTDDCRVEKAFLRFDKETNDTIRANTQLGSVFDLPRDAFLPSLRTPVGVDRMDVSGLWDYVAFRRYPSLSAICKASNVKERKGDFWGALQGKLEKIATNLLVSCRINPFSPYNYHVAFFSNEPLSPSDQMNVIIERDTNTARSICCIFNSVLFFAQFFLAKEESTGRFLHIRLHDLQEMILLPDQDSVPRLCEVFEKYKDIPFPSLRCQFDQDFDSRYDEVWSTKKSDLQQRLWSVMKKGIDPFPQRISFDKDVLDALGVNVSTNALLRVYSVFVEEMISIKHLSKD